jgi:hypothetical protein
MVYTATTHEMKGMMLDSIVFRRELCQPCNLFSLTSLNRRESPHEMAV